MRRVMSVLAVAMLCSGAAAQEPHSEAVILGLTVPYSDATLTAHAESRMAGPRVTKNNLRDLSLALGGDMLTTEWALASGNAREANWVVKSRAVRWGFNAGAVFVAAKGIDHLDRHGHHRAARWTKRGIIASKVAVMVGGAFISIKKKPKP
jgi:hypothetical protein